MYVVQLCFFDWWISEDRATLMVGVALINVSQFFFSADHGNRVRFAVMHCIYLYSNVHEFPKSTTWRPLSYSSSYYSEENSRVPVQNSSSGGLTTCRSSKQTVNTWIYKFFDGTCSKSVIFDNNPDRPWFISQQACRVGGQAHLIPTVRYESFQASC